MAGETILVVDDGRENRDFIIEYVLEPNGFKALAARDGKEGLEMIARHSPDLVLLDYQMPRMSGADVLRAMAASGINIPVILMTFYGSEEIAVEVYRLGVRDYLKKPFTDTEMLESIERSLTEVRLRKEKEALTERLIQANREMQLRLQELNVLYSVGKSVTSLMELDKLIPRILDAATKVTNAEEAYLYLVQNNRLMCVSQKRHQARQAEITNVEVEDRLAAHVVETAQPLVLNHQQLADVGYSGVSAAWSPLVLQNHVLGALGIRNLSSSAHTFTKHDSGLLSALSDYAAIAIQNARNVETVRRTKDNEKSRIRTTFQRFVPPQVVDQILDDPAKLQLGGTRKTISVLFVDIRGYTAYSETQPPERVVEMLNDYLSLAANVMMSYGGTLDKYLGDGLMTLFNAPDDQPNHVEAALEAALMLQQATQSLSDQRGDGLSFSIGIHVGEAVVGYIGTDIAINYTAVGDVVNLAKRLQEAAKPGQILVDDAVLQLMGARIQAQELGELKIRGRQKPSRVYELLGMNTPDHQRRG